MEKKIVRGICCSNCHIKLKDDDFITVDSMYVCTHFGCEQTGLDILKYGTYGEIEQIYPNF